MRSRITKTLIGLALPLGIMLAPASAHALETPPNPAVACANARAQLATAQGNLTGATRLAASYQSTINSLMATRQTLINRGLGESATVTSLTNQINMYQTLLNNALAQQSTYQWQVSYDQWLVFIYCGSSLP